MSNLAVAPTQLIHWLTADPHTPSPAAFRSRVLQTAPSIQRRARLLSPNAHFSYVTPFPVQFPYDIGLSTLPPHKDKAEAIEAWLVDREAIHPHRNKFFSKNRDQPRFLIALSQPTLDDCLPHLDVGDAFATLRTTDEGSPADAVQAREDLIDILSGHAVLMSSETTDDPRTGFAPWSLRYSGHQFGNWAGQLGDGRAVSIRKLVRFCVRALTQRSSDYAPSCPSQPHLRAAAQRIRSHALCARSRWPRCPPLVYSGIPLFRR